MEPIKIKGIALLNDEEKETVNKLLDEYYKKIQRQTKKIISLKIHFKEYKKDGKRKKYSINAEAVTPAGIFSVSAFDWDFARTIHKAMKKIMNKAEHELHSSEQH